MGNFNTQKQCARRSGTEQKQASEERKERRLLSQLAICTVLFLSVLAARTVFPEKMIHIQNIVLSTMVSDTDFRSALTELGSSISDSGKILEDLNLFCAEVFGPAPLDTGDTPLPPIQENIPVPPAVPAPEPAPEKPPEPVQPVSQPSKASQKPVLLAESAQTVPAVGTVLLKADYKGPELPQRDTMDQLSLGSLETTTPVMGRLTSKYGWRTHPISKKQHFHGGTDISGKMGTPIKAFADGTVDYIGRDQSYGLYIQLDHGNGIKSFYAHCSKLCAEKGQTVKMGEKIAEVGSTGCSTGPHLHLELKCGGKRLNPAYYIQFTNS